MIYKVPTEYKFLKPLNYPTLARLGNPFGDGGYIVPMDIIQNVDMLLSFGVGNDWSFEEDFYKHNKNKVIQAYDGNITIDFLNKILEQPEFFWSLPNVTFNNTNIDDYNTLTNILTHLNLDGKTIYIKMDIEGYEYSVIDDLVNFADTIAGFVAEFHCTNFYENENDFSFTNTIKLLQTQYDIIHLHANNWGSQRFIELNHVLPDVCEFTFINKRYIHSDSYRPYVQLPIDKPNIADLSDWTIQF